MNQRTLILSALVEAAKHLEALQDALTRAYVLIEERRGSDALDARLQVEAARDAVYNERLGALVETAITVTGRMP